MYATALPISGTGGRSCLSTSPPQSRHLKLVSMSKRFPRPEAIKRGRSASPHRLHSMQYRPSVCCCSCKSVNVASCNTIQDISGTRAIQMSFIAAPIMPPIRSTIKTSAPRPKPMDRLLGSPIYAPRYICRATTNTSPNPAATSGRT